MKKLLICITIVLVLILTIITVIKGLKIGGLSILGIQEIKQENNKLDTKLEEATRLVSTDYPNQLTEINEDTKSMQSEKQKYQDMIAVSTESEIAAAIQKQKYSVDKLWAKLGTLATDEGLDAKFELTSGDLVATATDDFQYYNINFTVEGSYVGISLYISDLEEDSELNFKIENFKMEPVGSGDTVKATFSTKNIGITGISKKTVNIQTGTENETTDNTTNTTNTTGNTSILNTINEVSTSGTKSDTTNTANATNTANSTNSTR